jgi:hypothetical protein
VTAPDGINDVFSPNNTDGVETPVYRGMQAECPAAHFKCYEAEGEELNLVVDLADQFELALNVLVEEPELFCNPVDKNGEGILNLDVHLTCYEIDDDSDGSEEEDADREVLVENQFGGQVLEVEDAKLLCVPSGKLGVAILDDDDDDDDDDD